MRDREFKKLSKKQLLKLLIKREETYQAFREGKETDPSLEQLKEALEREEYRSRFRAALRSTVCFLLTLAAAAVLLSEFIFPVFRITGAAMAPALEKGDLILGIKSNHLEKGDLIAFYANNKILVKRVIASGGDQVDIRDDGTVYVNEEILEEPYLEEKSAGNCDVKLPCQVLDGEHFVMGDARSSSVDSRSSQIGCIAEREVAGKLVFRLWPLKKAGLIHK